MTIKKKKALKKLLGVTEKELNDIIEKVVNDWANNVITTKYQTSKSIDTIINELQ